MMKIITIIISFFMTISLLAGCGGGSTSANPEAEDRGASVTSDSPQTETPSPDVNAIQYHELTSSLEITIDGWALYKMFIDDELNAFCGRIQNLEEETRVPTDSEIVMIFYDNDNKELFRSDLFPGFEIEKDDYMGFSFSNTKQNASDIKYVSVEQK